MLNTILPDSELELLLLLAVAEAEADTPSVAVFKSGFLEAEFSDTLI
jgi:hypothetical protein